jgi:hypothetical protein
VELDDAGARKQSRDRVADREVDLAVISLYDKLEGKLEAEIDGGNPAPPVPP